MNAQNMTITESALARIKQMREKEGNPVLMLRVTVLGGGCSGFQYELVFDDKKQQDDLVFKEAVLTDPASLPFLEGATVDYAQTMMSSKFVIKNPNASSACGCGNSFAVKM